MKKLLLVSAIAALSVGTANASTGVYGQVSSDFTVDQDNNTEMTDLGARVGVKGSTPVTNDKSLNMIYQAELEAVINDENKGLEKYRDSYIGVQGKQFGTLQIGRLSGIQEDIEFDANISDSEFSGLPAFGTSRTDKTIKYTTPSYQGIQLAGQHVVDGEEEARANGSTISDYGVNGHYTAKDFKIGASYIHAVDGSQSKKQENVNSMRLSGQVTSIPQLTLTGVYQFTDFEASETDENAIMASAVYDVPNSAWGTYVEVDTVMDQGGNKGTDVTQASVGGSYSFNSAVSGRVYAGMIDDGSDDSTYKVGTGITYKF